MVVRLHNSLLSDVAEPPFVLGAMLVRALVRGASFARTHSSEAARRPEEAAPARRYFVVVILALVLAFLNPPALDHSARVPLLEPVGWVRISEDVESSPEDSSSSESMSVSSLLSSLS